MRVKNETDAARLMNILTIDVADTHVKTRATKQTPAREVACGSALKAKYMVESLTMLAGGWTYGVVPLGYPALLVHRHAVQEPQNLGRDLPMELAQQPRKKRTDEDYVGIRGLAKPGIERWKLHFFDGIEPLKGVLELSGTVIGGGNARKLQKQRSGCRANENANESIGGFRPWTQAVRRRGAPSKASVTSRSTPSAYKQPRRVTSVVHPDD